MVRVPSDVAATQRARWLSDLSDALEEAQRLLWQLAGARARAGEAHALAARIEAARAQVRSLQIGRQADLPDHLCPEWSKSLPWDRRVEDCGV